MIELNEAEQRLCRYLAKRRNTNNRKNNVKNRRVGPQSDEQTDLEGIAAELAFCKMVNVFPDTDIADPSHLPEWDCRFSDGTTIDVKASTYPRGKLLATIKKRNALEVDLYVLMIGVFPRYRLAGWVHRKELFQEENLTDLGHGETYAMEQAALRKTIPMGAWDQ